MLKIKRNINQQQSYREGGGGVISNKCCTLIMFDESVDFVGFIGDAGSGTIENGPLASPGCR